MKKVLVLACVTSCLSSTLFAANEQDSYRKGYEAAQNNKNTNAFIQGVLASTQDTSTTANTQASSEPQASNRQNSNRGNNDSQSSNRQDNRRDEVNPQTQNRASDNRRNDNSSSANQRNERSDVNSKNNNTTSSAAIKEKAFFNENGRHLGVITTPSGLQYKVLKAGLGRMPQAHNAVKITYEGRLIDNRVFEQDQDRVLHTNKSIAGLAEGLQTMRERGKTRFFIPSHLAYGAAGTSHVPPNSTLIFDVELVKVE